MINDYSTTRFSRSPKVQEHNDDQEIEFPNHRRLMIGLWAFVIFQVIAIANVLFRTFTMAG